MLFAATWAGIAIVASAALYEASSPVKSLNASNFHQIIKTKGGPALVEFYSSNCPHCRNFAPEYEKAAMALEGLVNVYASEDPQIGATEQVRGVPTVKWYFEGKASEFGGAPTADALVDFAMKKAKQAAKSRLTGTVKDSASKSGHKETKSSSTRRDRKTPPKTKGVISLDSETFKSQLMTDAENVWFVMFYAPWCGHCKALTPTWEELAARMEGRVRIAKIDATTETELASQFDVRGYPTLLLFPAGKKSRSRAIPYSGQRDLEMLAQYAMKHAVGAIKAKQLISHEQFVEECEVANTLCMINFLPHIYDSSAKERKAYLKIIKQVMIEKAGLPLKYFWIEAGNSLELERALHLEFGWPAAIIVSAPKKFYATMRGGYTQKSVEGFVDSVALGRLKGEPLPDPIPRFPTLKPWDGKDAPPPRVEETFDVEVDGGEQKQANKDIDESGTRVSSKKSKDGEKDEL